MEDIQTDLSNIDLPKASSGDDFFSGSIWTRADPIADLRGQSGTDILNRMRLDAEVAAALLHVKAPIQAGDWRIDPAEEGNAEEEQIAEECRQMLMPGANTGYSTTSKTWNERLSHALTMLDYGFSLFEKGWGTTPEGQKTIAWVEPILAPTIWKWNYEPTRGDLQSATQTAFWPDGHFDTIDIDAWRLVPLVFNREGKNNFGRAMTRPAYLSWYSKKCLLILDGIIKERFGGVPIAKAQEPGAVTPAQLAALKQAINNFRIHQEQFLFADGFDINLVFPGGANSNLLDSVKYHDGQISQIMMSELMKIGLSSESGGRSVADTKAGLLFIGLGGIAAPIEDAFLQHLIVPYVIQRYGIRKKYPALRAPDFSKMRHGELIPLIERMVNCGVLRPDDRLEEYIREQLTIPEADPATAREIQPQQPFGGAPGQPGADGNGNGNGAPKNGKQGQPTRFTEWVNRSRRRRFFSGGAVAAYPQRFNRPPYAHEAHMPFNAMADYLDKTPREIWHRAVAPVRKDQIKVIARSAARATDAQLAKGQFPAPSPKAMVDELGKGLLTAYAKGRRSVVDEAKAQGAPSAIKFQDPALDQELADLGSTRTETNWIKTLASALGSGILGAMLLRAKEAAITSRQSNASVQDQQTAITQALNDLSIERLIADLSGQVSRSYSTGRNDQMQAMSADITTCFYSAIMDQGTCDVCAALDGAEHELGDPAFDTPNPECDWPPYCRCTTIPIFQGAQMPMQEAA